MIYKIKELCEIYNIEYNKEKFIEEFKNYLDNYKENTSLYINQDGYDKFKELYNSKLLNIFEFINSNNYILDLGNWFYDIWIPLFDKKDILITNNILDFLGFSNGGVLNGTGGEFRQQKKNYIKFLNKNNLEYKEIKYDNEIINQYEYIQNDIKNLEPRHLVQKTWILLNVENFKESIMLINTKCCKQIRKYYIILEKILYDYSKYITEYNFKQEKIVYNIKSIESKYIIENKNNEILKIKNESEKQLQQKQKEIELANKRSLRIKNYLNNVSFKDIKNEYIYIATTKQYAANNLFKIGSTTRICKRIKDYQTGRHPDDEYYYCVIKSCYNSKDLDKHINNILSMFLSKKNKELYCLHYNSLLDLVNFIIDNYDNSIEYVNNFIKNKLENVILLDPVIPEPIKINNISYTVGNNVENIDELKELLNEILTSFIIQNKFNISRQELLSSLNLNINKNTLWNEIKNILNWKNSKQIINYNNNKFMIAY
ncbi:MTG-like gene family protein [Alphaentomopoxvirus acuprea]|uniref:MTG-like gene family protein n=1 Tax=Alphaentomopoxvirus acuprea TaxID=62099 RepID=W6JIL0_9POXV|nr:MTG-like gene family protein [Anomala cuprea entomopoxvirus]YP_009001725.1 MTG-like gene family protein [Anomala cuprea entomopoxvirus]BAO49372.1 MTG-like gene family protein [Anomala cuprea entomopoxvirus]BAO49612.1 MTG-like gene family protein [Anomala cuprea entomopoxvirus]